MFRPVPLLLVLAPLALGACAGEPSPITTPTADARPAEIGEPQGEPIQAVLTSPPHVPPPIDRDHAARVVVEMEVVEKVMEIAEGVEYTFWTFGGSVPGSFIRVRQGDVVEFHLQNHPDNKMPHNIDLHAVTGPGGGAASTFTAPGKETVFSFKALNPGLYVYHCATAPVGMHIANGMYGLILVEPPEGLPPVDREYYVMQGDFYTPGAYKEKGAQPFDMQKAIDENPSYVLFNGRDGALTGEGALKANTGEKVRLFIGNGGPNLVSSFHVIGEIFDTVHTEGGSRIQENVQTTLIPAGGSAIVDYVVDVPGTYVLVDHSIFRAFNKGAIGLMEVGGEDDRLVYSGQTEEKHYAPGGATAAPAVASSGGGGKPDKKKRLELGRKTFDTTCSTCHQATGEGLPGVFPPLAASDYLNADPERAVEAVVHGLSGPVTVNGKEYDSVMPPMGNLSDDEIADVLTYVTHSWGNQPVEITPDQVEKVRRSSKKKAGGGGH